MRLAPTRNPPSINWIERAAAVDGTVIRARIEAAQSVLDIGSGIYPQTLVDAPITLCVEPYEPYIDALRERAGAESRYVFLNTTWERALAIFAGASVDVVTALDVIEHLRKDDGRQLLAEAERVARKQVVVFTPLGYYKQSYGENDLDRWGFRGGYWQTHRSGWTPHDFDSSWEIVACADLHQVDENNQPLEKPFGAFWAIKTLTKA